MTYTDVLEKLTYSELQELRDYLQEEQPNSLLLEMVEQELELWNYIH